jgi:deoxyribose-phosphate aldolase
MTPDALSREQLARRIDHAVLRPDAVVADVHRGCEIAARWNVASVCVRPCDVKFAKTLLAGSGVETGTVISFPHGSCSAKVKAYEAAAAVQDGADELDMVVNLGLLRSGELAAAADDIAGVVAAAGEKVVKVILECGYLTREEMAMGCKAAMSAAAAFVKTSTGFGPGGATTDDVQFLRQQVGNTMRVKASGGIKTLADALAMIRAGADRLGTSNTETILGEIR